MDTARFDRLVAALADRATRRVALRAVGAGGVGASLAVLGLREDALACKENGETCSRRQAERCCSGTCEKKNGKRQCVKTGGAFGCTNRKRTDACEGAAFPCPNNPNGECVVDEKQRPFCSGFGFRCFACQTDEDCRDELGNPNARCFKQCRLCDFRGSTICVVPPDPVGP